jgi:D-arabinose 1-dehydrogenase-like Zn-dependent alcohol dehydrogenase
MYKIVAWCLLTFTIKNSPMICAENKIYPQVQIIKAEEINDAWEQVVAKKARYRFVIDAATI